MEQKNKMLPAIILINRLAVAMLLCCLLLLLIKLL